MSFCIPYLWYLLKAHLSHNLKGSKTASMSVCMDIDFKAPEGLSEEERKAWLSEQMARVPELVLSRKDELVPLMLERSATKGYHFAFRRNPGLDQEGNLKWASELLGLKYDEQAKDITRVYFTTTADENELLYLDDELFDVSVFQCFSSEEADQTTPNRRLLHEDAIAYSGGEAAPPSIMG